MKSAPPAERASSHSHALLAFLGVAYPALALASTWPLALDLDGLLPLGTLSHTSISLPMIWSLWWTSDRLAEGLAGYWDAPILFPFERTFALSEPSPLLGFVASPLFYLGLSPVLVANLVLLAMLTLNGWMMFLLLRRLGIESWAAALGGACVVVLPFSHREIAVLHLVPLAGILGSLWAAIGWSQRPTPPRALGLGLALAATYLISGQQALFLLLSAIPAFACLIGRPQLQPRALLGLAAGALLCAGLVAPVVSAELEAKRLYSMERPARIAQAGAALPRDWWASSWPALLPVPGGQEPRRSDRLGLHPGSAKLVLALVGLVCGFRNRSRRRSTAFVTSLLAGSLLVSMLPFVAGGEPFARLRSLLPGLGQVRSFYRAGVFAQLAVVMLAAFSLDALLVRARETASGRPRHARSVRALAVLLGLAACIDLWPRQQRFAPAPSLAAWAPWTRWIRDNVRTDEAIFYLPMVTTGRMSQFEAEAEWMFLQTVHGRPMVNGYWGVMPRAMYRIASETAHFPQARAHHALEGRGVRWIVVRPSWMDRSQQFDPALWRPAYQNEALDVAVYEVVSRRPEPFAPITVPR